MIKFLKAAFKISFFEIAVILAFGAVKYLLVTYGLAAKLTMSAVWIGFGAFLLLVLAWGIIGAVENRGISLEDWQAEAKASKKKRLLATFVQWGQAIPIAFGYLLFIYFLAPTTLSLFLVFVAGIILRNSIDFLTKKKGGTIQTAK